ncbi:MAG TPA: inositol oxygenase family protein [Pirellulales bacterium]|nr:inositol oxygenase family protein [Pirellulales bacterium]
MNDRAPFNNPLRSLDDWEDFVEARYPLPGQKAKDDYRDYDKPARDTVREFYRLNHRHQTYDFVLRKKQQFLALDHREMTVLEAMEYLNTLVDDSDPDIDLSQREHLLQTSEAIRADGHDDWFVLTGLIHDLGKILCLFGEPQWAVVGDTFPVGCAFSDRIVYPEFLADNPDRADPRFRSSLGVYEAGRGLANVQLSWGHDEYLYHVVTQTGCALPEPALYMIRYHSFYPWHREEEYGHLLDERDREMLPWVRKFNAYDLYSKSAQKPDWDRLAPYYTALVDKYLPGRLRW